MESSYKVLIVAISCLIITLSIFIVVEKIGEGLCYDLPPNELYSNKYCQKYIKNS